MLILAIDTSAIASAALVTDDSGAGGVLAEFATEDTRSHAEVLAPRLAAMLAEAGVGAPELDAMVVGVGPGPFTGLRSGIATARTLNFVWKQPLHGMMSLDAIAWMAKDAAGGEFVVTTDARRREVYWATYQMMDGRLKRLDGPHVGAAGTVPELPAYGAGAGLYAEVLEAVPAFAHVQPEAAALGSYALELLAAGEPLLDTTPLYLRESDAKVPGPRKRVL